MKRTTSKMKMNNNKNNGDEETVAAISFGELKYCKGVASIL